MIRPKKYAKYALGYLAIVHLFIAAAAWRMSGIYDERIYSSIGDMELTRFISQGYLFVAAGAFLTAAMILLSLKLMKSGGKHRA